MSEEIVRILRVVEYVGPRSAVEYQVSKSIQGTRQFPCRDKDNHSAQMRITAVTVGAFAEVISDQAVKLLFPGEFDASSSETDESSEEGSTNQVKTDCFRL